MDQYLAYEIINIVFSFTGMILSLLGLVFSMSFRHLNKFSRYMFIIFFSTLIAYSTSNVVFLVSIDLLDESYVLLSKLSLFFESLFSAFLMPLITVAIIHVTHRNPKKSKALWAVISLFFIYVVLLIITQFTTFIYYITPDNSYHRGSYYQLLLVPPILMMFINLAYLFKNRKNIARNHLVFFSLYIIIPLICMLIQMALYGIQFIVIGTTIAAILMFRSVVAEQLTLYVEQQNTMAKQKTDIMLLQMRPHFIYNTMSSIYYLCAQDPKKAQTLVGDFTTYLRKNMSAIATHELIPFSEELEHTRAYLAVEKARYEKLLFVDYKPEFTDFSLPPLTLQPIVENSVKHGLDQDLPPLHVQVRTYQKDENVYIVVKDNGPGYDPTENQTENQKKVHIGLDSVKERLKLMCNGTIKIEAAQEGGTIVTICIPK